MFSVHSSLDTRLSVVVLMSNHALLPWKLTADQPRLRAKSLKGSQNKLKPLCEAQTPALLPAQLNTASTSISLKGIVQHLGTSSTLSVSTLSVFKVVIEVDVLSLVEDATNCPCVAVWDNIYFFTYVNIAGLLL